MHLLYSLSPKEDPLAVLLMMDYLALKAKDYAYLLVFNDVLKVGALSFDG